MGIILFFMVLLLHQSTTHPSIQKLKQQHQPTTANNNIKNVQNTNEHSNNDEMMKDNKETGKQIIGSSVLSSVSVILNGEEPQFTDAVGQPIPKPQALPLQVASPINLLNPDRYEFYTFDDSGNLVKRLMTIKEIQSIVANGDGEGSTVLHNAQIDDNDPDKNVKDIVASVQNVLHKQVEENKNSSEQSQQQQNIMLDTPDVSSSWSMILPAIFGNTGGEIFPQNRPQQVVMTPDSDVVEPTKPNKRKQKPKPIKHKINTTTTMKIPSSSANNVQENTDSTTNKTYIINNKEVIKPLFNRNDVKVEYFTSSESTATEVAQKISSLPATNPTKRRTKPKPTKAQTATNNDIRTTSTTKKSVNKRKSTTTTTTSPTSTILEESTIPTTKKAHGTKRKQPTRNPETSSNLSDVSSTISPTKYNKRKTSTMRNPSTASSISDATKYQTSTKAQNRHKISTTTTSQPTTSTNLVIRPQQSTTYSITSTTSHTTHKVKPVFNKNKVPSTTHIPVAYSVSSTTQKKKIGTRIPITTSGTIPTKRMKNKNKTTSTTSTTSTGVPTSTTKIVQASTTPYTTSTTIKAIEELKPTKKVSILSHIASSRPNIEVKSPSSSTQSISYDMLSGQDAATTLSLNAIMNSLTESQTDIKTQMSFDKIVDSLKDDSAQTEDIKNITKNHEIPLETQNQQVSASTTTAAKLEVTTIMPEEQTTIINEDFGESKEVEVDTTILPPLFSENQKIENGENIVRIEPLFAELLDPILTDLTTTESPDLTTTENSIENETTPYESSETNESLPDDDDNLTRLENLDNNIKSPGGSSEFTQRIDEFINKNLDTAETSVPVKELTNKLSGSQNFSPNSSFSMSEFIKEAATVASMLEDNTKGTSIDATSLELNNSDEIQTLLTDVLSQMTNNPILTGSSSPSSSSSTSKPINETNPIFYANKPLNHKQSNDKDYTQMNTPSPSSSSSSLSSSSSVMHVPPPQELTPHLDSNDKFHKMDILSLQLNQMNNKNSENFDENIRDKNNNKLQTTSTSIFENNSSDASYYTDDENTNNSSIETTNDANNSDDDDITSTSVENYTTSNEITSGITQTEKQIEKTSNNEVFNGTKSDILLSTPVTTKDDTVLITTLMASMAQATGTTSSATIKVIPNKVTTTTTVTPGVNNENFPSVETFKDEKQFTKEKDDVITTSSTISLNENSSEIFNVEKNNNNNNDDVDDSNSGNSYSNINKHKNSIEDKTMLQLSQDSIVKVLQKTTELPLQMTTIFYSDDSSNTSSEEKPTNLENEKQEDREEDSEEEEEITNNSQETESVADANTTTKPTMNFNGNEEDTMNDKNNSDISDDSFEQSNEMSTVRINENETTEKLHESITLENLFDDDNIDIDSKISTTVESQTESDFNPVKATNYQKNTEPEDSYVKLGESTKSTQQVSEISETTESQLLRNETSNQKERPSTTASSIKRTPSTLKPIHYFKQPVTVTDQKVMTFNGSQQRPIVRPAALSNLKITQISQVTRPPVKLDPTPEKSLGLEASIMDLQEDIQEFARLCNELAFSYWTSITSEKISSARSLVISPFALTSMLSMVFLGARGSTSGEMNEILRLDDMVTFNPHLVFKNITESVEKAKDSGIASSAFVRELFSDRNNGKILQFFKDKVHQFYSGHVEEVNFNVVNDIIRRRTNLLIKRHANGKVMEYLRTNSVWVNGPLSTVSANLFQTDCSKASTIDRDGEMFFQVSPSVRQRRLVPVPAVVYRNGFTAGYDNELDATAVAFGSADETVSTIYVMPGQHGLAMPGDNLERLEKYLMTHGISKNAWSHLLTSLMERPGLEIQLPRFSHRSFINASLGLQKLGLKALFNSDEADLRGLTGSSQKDVHLADMIQINTFSTCGEEKISDHHHVEMYPAPPLRKRNSDLSEFDSDNDESEMLIDFGSIVQQDVGRSLYDDLLDPKYLEVPLPLRPRQARIPDSPRLRLDKPFIYFVRHNPTGMILFMGRFNPRLLP